MPGYVYRAPSNPAFQIYSMEVIGFDTTGAPSVEVVVDGVTYILCNNDGSMARGTAGMAPPQDPYAPGWAPSPWEEI